MAKVVNIIGSCRNVGKTYVMEGIIRELKSRGFSIATIKHDVHGFDIEKEGKDTYKHRQAGSETVIISSKNRLAMIKELQEEIYLNDIIRMVIDKDIILVEGYKKSNLRKIEIYRSDISSDIITPKHNLIAVASNEEIQIDDVKIVSKEDFKVWHKGNLSLDNMTYDR